MSNQEFTFTVDSALLGELGERLVPSDHIALSELVKNSYDADAKNALISIQYDNESIRYVISDDGSGMTLDEVRKYWMKIGTTHKKKEKRSKKYGRLRTGEKGVGRFCVRRLGYHLKLETIAYNDDRDLEGTTITFNWDDFRQGTDVSKIKCEGNTEILDTGETGTKLTIWGKSENILGQQGYNYLRRQMLMLASYAPNIKEGYAEDPGFNISINAPDFEGGDEPKDVREKFYKSGWGELSGVVDNNGYAKYEFDSEHSGKVTYKKNKPFVKLRNAKLNIGIVPYQKEELRDPSLIAKYVLQDMINKWGGVHTRFNGFRVYPYGDPGDDWLNIEKDKARRLGKPSYDEIFNFAKNFEEEIKPARYMLSLLSSRSYIGVVDITLNSGLIPKLDRQGFIENKAFEELKNFIRFGIDWSTIYRDRYVRHKTSEKLKKEIIDLEESLNKDFSSTKEAKKDAIQFLDKTVTSLAKNLDPKLQKETTSKVKKSLSVLESVYEERESQIHHLRLLASTSTMTLLFAHEVKGMLSSLSELSSSLDLLRENLNNDQKVILEKAYGPILTSRENLSDLLNFTFSVIPSRAKSDKVKLHLKDHLEKIVSMFKGIIKHYSISVDYYSKVPNDLMVGPMLKVEFYAPVLNVFANAIKAVIAGSANKAIQIIAEKHDDYVLLEVLDSGIGLSEESYEEAFELFKSDPDKNLYKKLSRSARDEDLVLLGEGTGMGLSISRDILQANDGHIKFLKPFESWSTRVQLKLASK